MKSKTYQFPSHIYRKILSNLYFYSWSPINDGYVLPGQDMTFTSSVQFDYPVITSPFWDVYNLNIWASNDKGWMSAWENDSQES